jgi:hypothetical protein
MISDAPPTDRAACPVAGGGMGRKLWTAWAGTVALALSGCATGPLLENPVLVRPQVAAIENPVYVPFGPPSYGMVFEKVLDVVNDFFEAAVENRYDGVIKTFPKIAPGLEQPWKPGSPDFRQRLYATLQTVRHYAVVTIKVADDGGFFVDVKVYKELEDLGRPIRATAGSASFRSDNTVERQFEVVDPVITDASWVPIGRDLRLEQVILERIAKFDLCGQKKEP